MNDDRTNIIVSQQRRDLVFGDLRIENYLGFPTGISGMALMARAYNQAHKFGVETTILSEVVGFDTPDANKPGRFVLRLASGDLVSARSIPSDAA